MKEKRSYNREEEKGKKMEVKEGEREMEKRREHTFPSSLMVVIEDAAERFEMCGEFPSFEGESPFSPPLSPPPPTPLFASMSFP